jgi:hypothetical protein
MPAKAEVKGMIASKISNRRSLSLFINRQVVLVFVSLFFFVSCTTQGDFGRDRPSVYKDEILPKIRNLVAESKGEPITRFALTDREELLRTYRRRIGRDMSYPTVESYFTSTVASMGLTREPAPHLGAEIRSYENSRKPVVDVAKNARINPYALKAEIEEDVVIIKRASDLSRLIIADNELRLSRLAALQSAQPSDRDNVVVRNRENLARIKYIQQVGALRIRRYNRIIDVISIADPALNLEPARASVKKLESELGQFNRRPGAPKKLNPVILTKTA